MSELPKTEQENVLDIYTIISNDFDRTRYKAWPNVEKFINSFPPDTKFLEVGCGNGKNMLLRPENFKGCDTCTNFVKICKDKGLHAIEADATKLPFDDNEFDVTISVAVLHHLSSIDRRIDAIREMVRVTKDGGKLLIEVWCIEDNNRSTGPDTMVPWTYKGEKYDRYYHFFSKDEITDLVKSIDGSVIDSVSWEKFNWIVEATVKKVDS
jgi:ubiquinone/menaquinone biosynthesis C-methylase UbiE